MISFDYSKANKFISDEEIRNMEEITNTAADILMTKRGAGNDYLGWIDLPVDYDKDEFARIKKAADKIRSDSKVLVVVGIGGSYLGAKAAIDMLTGSFDNFKVEEAGTYYVQFDEATGEVSLIPAE